MFLSLVNIRLTDCTLTHLQDYLCTLEQNLLGLVSHLEQASRKSSSSTGKIGHWFRAVSDSEPVECLTYLRTAASDMSRTCEAIESHHNDTDDGLLVQNLQSIAHYIIAAKVRTHCTCIVLHITSLLPRYVHTVRA